MDSGVEQALSRMFSEPMGGFQPQAAMNSGGPSTVATGGDPSPPIGGIDIPPADPRDPFGGPRWAQEGFDPGRSNPFGNMFGSSFGTTPFGGEAISGPTQVPTFWSNANTFNPNQYAPLALPPGGWTPGNILNIGISRHSIRPNPV